MSEDDVDFEADASESEDDPVEQYIGDSDDDVLVMDEGVVGGDDDDDDDGPDVEEFFSGGGAGKTAEVAPPAAKPKAAPKSRAKPKAAAPAAKPKAAAPAAKPKTAAPAAKPKAAAAPAAAKSRAKPRAKPKPSSDKSAIAASGAVAKKSSGKKVVSKAETLRFMKYLKSIAEKKAKAIAAGQTPIMSEVSGLPDETRAAVQYQLSSAVAMLVHYGDIEQMRKNVPDPFPDLKTNYEWNPGPGELRDSAPKFLPAFRLVFDALEEPFGLTAMDAIPPEPEIDDM